MRKQLIKQSKDGYQLLKNRQFTEARKVFEEALLLAPDNIHFMTGLGDTLRQQKDFSAAAGYYRQVLEIAPNNQIALRGLGDALKGLLQFEAAIEFWKKYLHLEGNRDVFVLIRIADCYKALNNNEESQSFYLKALALKANDRFALIGLADLYHKQGLELRAIEYYDLALASGVTLINILTIAGNLHYRHGNFEKAKVYFEKALVQDPENSYALYGLGNYYRWKCDYRQAIKLWEKIRERSDVTVNLMSRLGDAYRNLGQFEDAERAYKTNLTKEYDMLSMVGIIKLYCLQARLKETCDYYDELMRNELNDDRQIFADVGEILCRLHESSLALKFYHHALLRHKKDSAAFRIIADRIKQLEALSHDNGGIKNNTTEILP